MTNKYLFLIISFFLKMLSSSDSISLNSFESVNASYTTAVTFLKKKKDELQIIINKETKLENKEELNTYILSLEIAIKKIEESIKNIPNHPGALNHYHKMIENIQSSVLEQNYKINEDLELNENFKYTLLPLIMYANKVEINFHLLEIAVESYLIFNKFNKEKAEEIQLALKYITDLDKKIVTLLKEKEQLKIEIKNLRIQEEYTEKLKLEKITKEVGSDTKELDLLVQPSSNSRFNYFPKLLMIAGISSFIRSFLLLNHKKDTINKNLLLAGLGLTISEYELEKYRKKAPIK